MKVRQKVNNKNKDYTRFRRSGVEIYGIWDDHDYGIDNGDRTNPLKEEFRQIWLDFLDEPKDSIRRKRETGMYQSYDLANGKIKLILLDVRYNREPKNS